MLKWKRKYEWDEWRELNPDLPDHLAEKQYLEERQSWDNFVDELRKLFQIRRDELRQTVEEVKEEFEQYMDEGFEKYSSGSLI